MEDAGWWQSYQQETIWVAGSLEELWLKGLKTIGAQPICEPLDHYWNQTKQWSLQPTPWNPHSKTWYNNRDSHRPLELIRGNIHAASVDKSEVGREVARTYTATLTGGSQQEVNSNEINVVVKNPGCKRQCPPLRFSKDSNLKDYQSGNSYDSVPNFGLTIHVTKEGKGQVSWGKSGEKKFSC